MTDTIRKFLEQLHIFAVQLQFPYLSKLLKPVQMLHICNVLRATSAEGGKKLGQKCSKVLLSYHPSAAAASSNTEGGFA